MTRTAMSVFALAALAAASASAEPVALGTFDSMINALNSGASVQYVNRYWLCDRDGEGPAGRVNATGGDTIDTWEYFFDKGFGPQPWVAFSKSKLIANYQSPTGGFVYDFVRTRVYQNGTVQISAQYLDVMSYNITMDETFVCHMDDGSAKAKGGFTAYAEAGTAPVVPAGGASDTCADEKLLRFHTFIVGHFSNAAQVRAEVAAGKQKHPFAEHIADVANQKIVGLPDSGNDGGAVWVLEESYYTMAGKTTPSPYLFRFSHTGTNNDVRIAAYAFPKSIPPSALRNNNTALRFKYSDLQLSPVFNPATYTYDQESDSYSVYAVTPLPKNTTFVLNETIAAERLTVMEDVRVNGHSVMPYSTPLLYDRI